MGCSGQEAISRSNIQGHSWTSSLRIRNKVVAALSPSSILAIPSTHIHFFLPTSDSSLVHLRLFTSFTSQSSKSTVVRLPVVISRVQKTYSFVLLWPFSQLTFRLTSSTGCTALNHALEYIALVVDFRSLVNCGLSR